MLNLPLPAPLFFEGINISFSGRERYGLIGANGSGKSTFMKSIGLNIILAHGVLHLLGYDHKNKIMKQKMIIKTVEIIKHLKLDHIKAKLSLEGRNG